jgi:hypothetical protein
MTDSFAEAHNRLWPRAEEKIPGVRAGMIATAGAAFAKYGINPDSWWRMSWRRYPTNAGPGMMWWKT